MSMLPNCYIFLTIVVTVPLPSSVPFPVLPCTDSDFFFFQVASDFKCVTVTMRSIHRFAESSSSDMTTDRSTN